MIQVEGLSMSYHGHALFENATFTIQPQERCGLVGRNGSGKSTLFRLVLGKETPDAGSISTRKHYTIGALDQHIHFTQPTVLSEAVLGLRKEEQDDVYKAERILFGLGFSDEDMDKSPSDLSGGYQLRLHLAKVLISEPDCLLLDEPTNYLDIVSIHWFTKFLQKWKGEFVLISHDREFMDSVCTHTMGIHRGKVKKVNGGTVAFYDQIVQQEEIHERTRANLEKKRAHLQSYVERFGAKASKATQAQSRVKQLQRIPTLERLKEIYHLDFHFNEAAFATQKMGEAQNISFAYSPEVPLIENFSLEMEKGDRIAIIGKNGRGKSTLLRLLARDLNPNEGIIKYSDHIKIGYFGQTNINRLHPQHSVEDEISIANPALNKTEIKGICGLMMFDGAKAEKRTHVLSGGEKSRVLLGKILAGPCNLLLLDEPTHHLDMESVEALIDALEEFDGTVIIVTHSELILKRLALDKIIICKEGKQEFYLGSYEDFLEKKGWDEAEKKEAVKEKKPIVKEKPKSSKPLNKEIEKIESIILKEEAEQQQDQEQLLEAIAKKESKQTQTVSKRMKDRKDRIDAAYVNLEELLKEREKLE